MKKQSQVRKVQREIDKILRPRYNSVESNPGETWSKFRIRNTKKVKGKRTLLFSVSMFFALYYPTVF